MPRQTALPATLPPRLITRLAAAAYVGVSPNTFDRMVDVGTMPRPRRMSISRFAWDVRELDGAIDDLPYKHDDDVRTPSDEGWVGANAA